MPDRVKPEVGRRARKAQETRTRILDAAEQSFIRDGYVATTMTTIAQTADVAVQTVYAVFANKRTILTELLAARTVGDESRAPLAQRAEWLAIEQEADPAGQLRMLAAFATRVGARLGELYLVMASAAGADGEIAHIFERQQQSRYADQQRIAASLAAKGALRDGLSVAKATDIMWAVANPRMYRTLVVERRWSVTDYERWLADVLVSSLLARGASSS